MNRPRRWSLGAALALSVTLLTSAAPIQAADPATTLLGAASNVLSGIGASIDSAVASATSNPCSGSGALKKSANGSLTVLLLGSDYRQKPYIGERTDSVIAMNIAKNGRVTMAAIPRDTTRIPLAGGGTSGARRINALYIGYKRSGLGNSAVDCTALDKVRKDVSKTLGTSIPYYAMIRMDDFQNLIDNVGGLRMTIRDTLIDYHYTASHRKVFVPKSTGYQMNGGGNCGVAPKKCRSALRYARSRYGTEGGTANSDYRRVRRQQQIVFHAIKRVLSRGSGSSLTSLLGASRGRIYTNLPKTTSGALALYAFAQGATFAKQDGTVFGPQRWATYTGQYTFQLKLADIRQWVDRHFRPVT